MNAFSKLAITASIALASVTFFGCDNGGSGGGGKEPEDGGGSGSGTTVQTGTNGSFIVTETRSRAATEDAVLNYYFEMMELSGAPLTDEEKEMYKEIYKEAFGIDIEKNIYTIREYDNTKCQANGTLKTEKIGYPIGIGYSISGNTLSLEFDSDEPINFTGSSTTLEGTWTRTKNVAASCREHKWCVDWDWDTGDCLEYSTESEFYCDEDYDITKAVFTSTTATFTRDVCLADEVKKGDVYKGWTINVIDCSNVEYSKGSEKVKINVSIGNDTKTWTYTYNNKTCTRSYDDEDEEYSPAQKQQACTKAANKYKTEGGDDEWMLEQYYRDYLYSYEDSYEDSYDKYRKCLVNNNFPQDLFGGYDDDYEKVLKKSLKKSLKSQKQSKQQLKLEALKRKAATKR